MTTHETHTPHRVIYCGLGYGYHVVVDDCPTGTRRELGDGFALRVVSGPYTSREQAQAEADRRNQETAR